MYNTNFPKDTFALGSSQYAGIYIAYGQLVISEKVKNNRFGDMLMVNHRQSLTKFYNVVIPDLKEIFLENAKEWGEEPKLEEWNSLDLKLKLLNAGKTTVYDLQKRILWDLFNLLKGKSWDLWSALNLVNSSFPEIRTFVKGNYDGDNLEANEAYGLDLYYFGSVLNLTDNEVREIFGDFDT